MPSRKIVFNFKKFVPELLMNVLTTFLVPLFKFFLGDEIIKIVALAQRFGVQLFCSIFFFFHG